MNRTLLAAVLCFVGCAPLCRASTDEIAGVVLDADGGKPIHHARVTAIVWKSRDHQRRDILVVLTREDGRFRFKGLPQGECEIRAQKVGYFGEQNEAYSSRGATVRADTLQAPLTRRLTPAATINVRVLDDHSLPINGAQLQIYMPPLRRGALSWDAETGKDGTARVHLRRGSYQIAALSPGTGTLMRAQGLTFLPVYYPGTVDPARAKTVDLAPGQELHIDIQVVPSPAREILGRSEIEGSLIAVSARPVGNDNYRVTWGLAQFDRASGDFRVSGLAPGVYVINLDVQISPRIYGTPFRKIVRVVDADVTGVVITSADRLSGW